MVKCLFVGDVRGRLSALLDRVSQLHGSKHGPFQIVFCVGEFFDPDGDDADLAEFLNGSKQFPIPVYFITADSHREVLEPDGNEIATNLCFLGNAGTKQVMGLRVAYLSGTAKGVEKAKHLPPGMELAGQFSTDDLEALETIGKELKLEKKQTKVDILLTSNWPKGVLNYVQMGQTPTIVPQFDTMCEQAAKVCLSLSPLYCLSGCQNIFYKRLPFENGPYGEYTRFIALGNVEAGSKDKDRKWLLALALEPLCSETTVKAPPPMTANPLTFSANAQPGLKRPPTDLALTGPAPSTGGLTQEQIDRITAQENSKSSQYFFNPKANYGAGNQHGKRRRKKRRDIAPRADCWYCLASDSCEVHLIASTTDEAYLTLPKGGVSAQHVQIVPVGHEECFATVEDGLLEHVAQYKAQIIKFFAEIGCIALFFERNVNLTTAMQKHAYLDAIPVPAACASAVGNIIESEAKRTGLSFSTKLEAEVDSHKPSLSETARNDGLFALRKAIEDPTQEYMYIEVSGGAYPPRLCLINSDEFKTDEKLTLPLHFGRQVSCRLLGCMNRVDWKSCIVPQHMEEKLSNDFKDAFAAFNPFK